MQILSDFKSIKNAKWICVFASLIAVLSYGYQVMHPTIGMDDTAIMKYFTDGWAPQVGRWTIFLLNKIFKFGVFTPYFMDVVGIIFLLLGALAFCVLLKRVSQDKIHTMAYVAFCGFFISSPFMGEVFIYYLHNGVGLSFFLVACSGLCIFRFMEQRKWLDVLWASLFLAPAIGCYEAFALVYIAMIFAVFLTGKIYRKEKVSAKRYWLSVGVSIVPLIVSIVLRSIICKAIVSFLGIEMTARSASSMKYWFMNDALVILKDLIYRWILRYVLAGEYIFGVRVFAITMVILIAFVIIKVIVNKKWSLLLYGVGLCIVPWLLVFVELAITPYRACQTLIFVVAVIWLLVIDSLLTVGKERMNRCIAIGCATILVVLLFRQCFSLNQYFYFDTLKSNNDERVCTQVAYEITKNCDTSKPVVFVGEYEMPEAYRNWVFLPLDSAAYQELGNKLDLFQKLAFYNYVDNRYGYALYEIGSQDPLAWMQWCEKGEGSQLYLYMEMLGFKFQRATKEMCEEKEQLTENYPVFPKEGSVVELEDCIIVKMGK